MKFLNGRNSSFPEDWDVKKFRFIFDFSRGLGVTKSDLVDEGVPCINYGEIHSKYGFECIPEQQKLKYVSESYLETNANSLLKRGDFVFADTSEDIEGSGNFTYLNSDIPTFAGYHTVIARLIELGNSRYIAYLFDSKLFRFQIQTRVSGVKVYSITQKILKECYLGFPSPQQQGKAVDFLDYKTSRIDRLIKKKKALIEKLKEQRIAVITKAVTKGIDKKVKMKPSGIEWLGDVPEHWKVKRLKFVAKPTGGGTPNTDVKEYWDGNIPWVSPKDMKKELILSTQDRITQDGLENSPATMIERGEVLIVVRSGILKHSIPTALSGIPLSLNQDLKAIIVNRSELVPAFLNHLISSNQKALLHIWRKPGCTVESIEMQYMFNSKIAIPPIEEQEKILKLSQDLVFPIDKLIEACASLIKKYSEYRSVLITAAVTGKIDVRKINLDSQK